MGFAAAADAASDGIKADCLAKRQSCQGTTPTISDDLCFGVPALNDDARAESATCLSKPCAEVQACLRTAAGN